jgi:hypothetical protein
MRSQRFPHSNKRSDDVNACFNGPLRIEDGRRHDGTVFHEGERENGRMFQPSEPVTVCDQFLLFSRCELEGEILRESFCVSLDCLVEDFRRNSVNLGQVSVQNHTVAPNDMNSLGNILLRPQTRRSRQVVAFCYNLFKRKKGGVFSVIDGDSPSIIPT